MQAWLMKSEPGAFSFDDLKSRPRRTEPWSGVRNYQARNFMRAMRVGDLALFYHSSCAIPGVAGVARVVREAYPDHTAWEKGGAGFDPGSTPAKSRWDMVDIAWRADFPIFVSLDLLREDPGLATLLILRRGNRLSITPVADAEFRRICKHGGWNVDDTGSPPLA